MSSIPVLQEIVNNEVKALEETTGFDGKNGIGIHMLANGGTQLTPASPPSPASAKTSLPTSTAGLTSSGNIPNLLSHILQGSGSNLVQLTETLPPLDGVLKTIPITLPPTLTLPTLPGVTAIPQTSLIPSPGIDGKQIIQKETKEGENYVDIT